jgi:hypothetical protein
LPTSSAAAYPARPAEGVSFWLAPLLVLIGSLALFCVNLDDGLPVHDELYHLLAARGLLETGEPRIAEGIYTRGYLYTWVVAQSFRLLGDGLLAGRLPAAVSMAALTMALFLWLRATAGTAAAWIAALLFATSPFAIGVAQFARFYGPQSLAFFLAAIAMPAVLRGPGGLPRRALLGAGALALLLLATHLQETTLLGMVGLAVWACLAVGLPWLADPLVPWRHKLLGMSGLLVLGLGAAGGLWATGELGSLWARYRWTALFNEGNGDRFWYYHAWLSLFYPSLWPATGLLGLIAVVARPVPGLLALAVFAVSFLLNSFAGGKGLRYLAYAYPFLFALWGIGIAELWPRLRDLLSRLAGETGPALGIDRAQGLGRVLAGLAVAFLLLANPAWLRSVSLLADVTIPPEEPYVRWRQAEPALAPWLNRVETVVTTAELETLYHLGRYDVLLSRSRLEEQAPERRHEMAPDWRTGRPIISRRDTLARLMDCTASGLLISHRLHWQATFQADAAAKALIEERGRPLPLPASSLIMAWTWEQPTGWVPPAGCAEIRATLAREH